MANPRQFARNLFARARSVEINSGDALRDAIGAAMVTLVRVTPVGGPPTSPRDPHPGLARSNWKVIIPGESIGGLVAASGETEAVSRGLLAAKAVPTAGTAFISNFVPYINRLNEGSSTQAPIGFVQLAVIAAGLAASDVRLLRKRR